MVNLAGLKLAKKSQLIQYLNVKQILPSLSENVGRAALGKGGYQLLSFSLSSLVKRKNNYENTTLFHSFLLVVYSLSNKYTLNTPCPCPCPWVED